MEKNRNKTKILIVVIFILLFGIGTFINLKGSYLEYKELGDNYTSVFYTNLKYKYIIFGTAFVIFYITLYLTNKGIKKGLKEFFDKEQKEMPRLWNKSISFIISVILSTFMANSLMQKIILFSSNSHFGISDPVYGLDLSFYIFQKPLLETMLLYLIFTVAGITIYMAGYYILIFNKYFDGVEGKMLLDSKLVKSITRNLILVVVLFAVLTILNTTNISLTTMLTIDGDIDIIGAGYTDIAIQRWGYMIFAVVIVIFAIRAINALKKRDTTKVMKNLLVIPGYLFAMFFVIIVFNLIFVNSNTLDKQKQNLEKNISFTKNAYGINIEEVSLDNTGTITQNEVTENENIINNMRIVSSDAVLKTLQDSQTGTGYYQYRKANIAAYDIKGEYRLVYISPREIKNSGRTYNNQTYEYTHGVGQIVVDSTNTTENGGIKYVQKEISGEDDVLGTKTQEIYFGLETNSTIATNTKSAQEYNYTDNKGVEYTSNYNGKAGLTLGFADRLILGMKTGDMNLAFSGEMTDNSKILINRNIIKRAKKAMPYLIYDENPYTVVTDDGKIVWVLDAYTVSNQYPYSQYSSIEHDDIKEKINYIRNSVKVIIDSYDGTMKFYITDTSDPIAMAYRSIYPTIFEDISKEIPSDISEHFVYPQYLYNVQAELIKVYHNVRYDVLYRTDDLWDFAKYNNTIVSKSSGTTLNSYYTMIEDKNKSKLGLVQIYTPNSKQNLISYLVGTTDKKSNKLKLYKFTQDSNILGPMQLDTQIEQDEVISAQIQALNTTGTRITKEMIAVPVDNTILYVESIYQTMLNVKEESKVPLLKKVVVASGNKLAIGDNIEEALRNLLSKEASKIEVENTDDIDGIIDAIIKANKNLNQSMGNNDWELMGIDIKKLQSLIDSLEKQKIERDKKKEQLKSTIKEDESSIVNAIENVVE